MIQLRRTEGMSGNNVRELLTILCRTTQQSVVELAVQGMDGPSEYVDKPVS